MSPILETLMSHCDSDFESSNISFNENKLGDVDLNSNGLTIAFERMEETI